MKKGKGQCVEAEPQRRDGKLRTRFSGHTHTHEFRRTNKHPIGLYTFRQHAAIAYTHTHKSVKQLGRLSVPALLINL